MRARILIAIATISLTGLWAGAGSKPASPSGNETDPVAGARDLMLAEAPRAEAAVASDLEAGRPSRLSRVRGVAGKPVTRISPPAEVMHDHAAMLAPAPVQELSRTASVTTDLPLRLTMATAPAAPIFGAARPIPGATSDADREPRASFPAIITRDPTIIIRGGMGSPHDDCKILPGGRSGGAAVNRMAPSPGGYGRTTVSSGLRGGIR